MSTTQSIDTYPWSGGAWGAGSFDPDAYYPGADYGQPQRSTVELANGVEIIDPFDLDNLLFIDKEKVELASKQLDVLEAEIRTNPDAVLSCFIGTGGTIAMSYENGVKLPKIDTKTIVGELPDSKKGKYKLASFQLPTLIDSADMEIDYWSDTVIAMSWMWQNMSDKVKERFAGFAVAHGTDTLYGAGATTSAELGPDLPFNVGFVAAQKSIEDKVNDVAGNVHGTLITLAELHAQRVAMPFVYFGGDSGAAYNAAAVVKVSDTEFDGFDSPMHKPAITYKNFAVEGVDQAQFNRHSLKSKNSDNFFPVILDGYLELDEIILRQGKSPEYYAERINLAKKLGSHAVLVTSFGGFTGPKKSLRALIGAAEDAGITLFSANPFPQGETGHVYESSSMLRDSTETTVILPESAYYFYEIARKLFPNDTTAQIAFIRENDYVGEQPEGFMQNAFPVQRLEDGKIASKYSVPHRTTDGVVIPRVGAPYILDDDGAKTLLVSKSKDS